LAKVLIADDESGIRRYLRKMISEMGHIAIDVPDGREALRIFREESVDLSIVDVNMPVMGGLAFLEEAKKQDPDAVIIIMTGYPSAETIVKTIEQDGYTYMAKPINPAHLRDLVEHGLATREQRLRDR
jgi:two-component system response regulator AtoC